MALLNFKKHPDYLNNVLALPNSAEFFAGRPTQKNAYRRDSNVISFRSIENKPEWETTEIQLKANSLFRIDVDGKEIKILCVTGSIWVTQEGDANDHILKYGEEFAITKKGIVLLQSLSDVAIEIKSKNYVKNDKD